jgi:hypothetical protein
MPIKPNVRTGGVDWTGENPGMLLKTDPAGDWSVLMLFSGSFGRLLALAIFCCCMKTRAKTLACQNAAM